MSGSKYLMENKEEAHRLDMKMDTKMIESQARWAGIRPGMQVADLGCGSGTATYHLHLMVQPDGKTLGIDISEPRIQFAKENYRRDGIEYICRDIREPLNDFGMFDFIWIRFVLEYYRSTGPDIIRNISDALRPGGILCLVDLDYNCLNHYGLSDRLKRSIHGIMSCLEKCADFDPYVGIKLYSYMYDLDFQDIDVSLEPHHLIFGELNEIDAYNFTKKLEVAGKNSGYAFEEYKGGYEEFFEEFQRYFADPRRFSYTPIITCRGIKPFGS